MSPQRPVKALAAAEMQRSRHAGVRAAGDVGGVGSMPRRAMLVWCAGAAPWWSNAQTPIRPALTIGTQGSPQSTLGTIAEAVVTQAFERAGIELKVARLPLLRSIESANLGETDGDMMRIADVAERYPNLVRVPTPLARADVVLYVRAGATQHLPREQLGKLSVGYTRGTFILMKHAGGLRTVEVGSVDQVFNMLAAGRIDAGLATYLDAEQALQRLELGEVVRWAQVWASEPVHLFLHRSRAQWVPVIDAALQQMTRQGVVERIYREVLKADGILPLPSAAGTRGR
jgi:polar amino acid transport system substrate-binding protein